MIGLGILLVIDLVWFMGVGKVWVIKMPKNLIWKTLKTGRLSVLALSSINVLLKVNFIVDEKKLNAILDSYWRIDVLFFQKIRRNQPSYS